MKLSPKPQLDESPEPETVVPKTFLVSARNSTRKKIQLETFDFNSAKEGRLSVRHKKTLAGGSDPFTDRFHDHFDKNGKPILFRHRLTKLMRGDGDAYDNEEDYASEQIEEEDEVQEYLSQQPDEIYEIVMHPTKMELQTYLEVDEVYNWRFDPEIKVSRSLSLDLAIPYEMGEDEVVARRQSAVEDQEPQRMNSIAQSSEASAGNPYG